MFPKRFPPESASDAGKAGAPGATDAGVRADPAAGAAQQQQDGAAVEYAIGEELAKFSIDTEAGVPVTINPNDARLPDARVAARELGLTQEEFGRALRLDAHLTAKAVDRANKQIDAAIAQLGPTFESERVAVVQWADTHLSPAEASELVSWFSHGNLATKFRLVQRLSGLKPGAMHNNNPPPKPREESLVRSLFPGRFDSSGNLLQGPRR